MPDIVKTIFIKAPATTFTIPADCLVATVHCISAGTSGATGGKGTIGPAGVGGNYAAKLSLPVTPGAVINCQIGTPSATPGIPDTWFSSTATVLAKGQIATGTNPVGIGNVGDIINLGGNPTTAGGGTAGPHGAGGSATISGAGGTGDAGFGGAGAPGPGFPGANGITWAQTSNGEFAGSGGGGGPSSGSSNGFPGGLYGGGGGGALFGFTGGLGQNGIIVFVYVSTTSTVTSGTYNFTLTNSDIVLEALDRIGVRGPAVTSSHMVSARRSLNLSLQTFSNRGVNLWAVDLQTINLVAGQKTYTVPPETVDILDAYYVQPVGGGPSINRILEPISRTDYASYSTPDLQGTVTTYWFDRVNAPTITLYQVPAQGAPFTVNYYRLRRIQDANLGTGEQPDVNYRFLDSLCADLAAKLAEKFNPAAEQLMRLKAKAAWVEAAGEDREKVPVFILPMTDRYWR